jgi:hypothetical protein
VVPHISESGHLRTRPRSLGSLALHGWDSSEDTSPPRRGAALPILASGVGQVGPVRQRAGGCEVGFDFSRDCVPGQPLGWFGWYKTYKTRLVSADSIVFYERE